MAPKTRLIHMLPIRDISDLKTHRLKVKGEYDRYHAEAGVAICTPDKIL